MRVGAVRIETDFQLQLQFGLSLLQSDISKPPSSFGFCAREKPMTIGTCRMVADETAGGIRHAKQDWAE